MPNFVIYKNVQKCMNLQKIYFSFISKYKTNVQAYHRLLNLSHSSGNTNPTNTRHSFIPGQKVSHNYSTQQSPKPDCPDQSIQPCNPPIKLVYTHFSSFLRVPKRGKPILSKKSRLLNNSRVKGVGRWVSLTIKARRVARGPETNLKLRPH